MGKYNILLVDDEEELRVGIREKICWETLGFSLVGEAANGQDALELAEQLCPDIVLTDIKMPFMDGLELCRRLKQQFPAIRLVIFSGFDEFAYAKQAIGMNVFEYLLKPLNATELSTVLYRLHEEMDKELAQRQNLEALTKRYQESLPALREAFFTRLLKGHFPPEQILERASRYEISLKFKGWVVSRIHAGVATGEFDELMMLCLQQFFEEHLYWEGCQLHWLLYDDDLVLLAAFVQQVPIYPVVSQLEKIRAVAQRQFQLPLTIGVGLPVKQPDSLVLSAQGAESALAYRMILGTGKTFYIGDLEPRHTVALVFGERDEQDLINAVKLGTPEKVRQFLQGVLQSSKETSLRQFQCYFLELLTCLIHLAREGDIPLEKVFGSGFSGAIQLTDFASPNDLAQWIEQCCLHLQELLRRQRNYATSCTIDKAKQYIQQNYQNSDLSVDILCEHLHLSPAYFSTLFKRETGLSFTAYVTKVRMETAAVLLRDTDKKTYLIAQETGYIDPNYFSYVFKRYYGISPSKYRAP